MPFLTTAILMALFGAGVIAIAFLTISAVRDYLRERRARHVNKQAAIMKQKLDSGEYEVIAGFFDDDNNWTDAQPWKASEVDETLEGFRDGVVYKV